MTGGVEGTDAGDWDDLGFPEVRPMVQGDIALERLLNLYFELLNAAVPLTRDELRQRVPFYRRYKETDGEAFRRAFERDKDVLRSAGFPLVITEVSGADPKDYRYSIEAPEESVILPDLAPDELAALRVAARIVKVGNTAIDQALLRLGGVIDTIPEEYAFPVEAVGAPLAELEVPAGLAELQEARRRCTVVRFGYRGTPREVEPLRIFYQRGWWYLTAYDRGHDDQRHFRVDRMTSVDGEPGPVVVATSEGYDPSRHDPVKPMEDPWAWGEGDPIEATLLIDPGWGMSIIPNLPPDVDVGFNPDGSAVVTLEVRNREGFRWLVLGLLEHGEILGPEELRADLVGWLSDMAGADQ